MKVCKYLRPEFITLDVKATDKQEILQTLASLCKSFDIVSDHEALYKGLMQREQTMSTGIGCGIGIPHTMIAESIHPAIILLRLVQPIEFEALDECPVDIIIGVIIPESQINIHIQILAGISRLCKNPDFAQRIRQATNPLRLWEDIENIENSMAFH